MGIRRLAAIAALSSTLIISSGAPVFAAAPIVTSTGLSEGQLVGLFTTLDPVFDGEVKGVRILVNGVSNATYSGDRLSGPYQAVLGRVPNDSDVDITVRAYDGTGAYGEATTRVHVDNVNPAARVTPDGYARIHGVTTFTFTDLSEEIAEIVIWGGSRVIARATSAPWVLTGDVGKGVSSIEITDRAGNVTRSNSHYIVDNTGPDVEINSLLAGRVAPSAELNTYVTDPAGVKRFDWTVDGKPAGTSRVLKRYFGADGTWHTVEVNAWDTFGNRSTVTRRFVVDGRAPQATWVSPQAGAIVRGNRVWSAIQVSDPSSVRAYPLGGYVDGTLATGATSGRVSGYRFGLPDGKHAFTWRVSDYLENVTNVTRTVIVDNTKPTLKVTTAPANNAKVKGTVKVTAAAADRNGIARVELGINGKIVAKDLTPGYAFAINTAKYGKTIKVQLRAFDRAGNVIYTPLRTWKR